MDTRILDELSVDQAWQHVLWLIENAPERISGSQDERTAAAYFQRTMEGYGLIAQTDVFEGYNSFPGTGHLRLLEPEEQQIESRIYAHIASTPPGGITTELVYVGSGAAEAYDGLDVRGKTVLAELSYAPPRPEKARIAADHGAAAIVIMNWGLPEHGVLSNGAIKGVWGNPTRESMGEIPQIAGLGITRRDGEHLRSLCQMGRVIVHVDVTCERKWMPLHQPWGRIAGGVEPEKFVLIGGHFDAWRPGVTDNAAGNAVKLELARVMAQHRSELRRGIHCVFWTGHEIGDMEGSTWFLDNHWHDLNENCAAYFNVDTVGMVGATRYVVASSDELARFHAAIEQDVLGVAARRSRLSRTGDQSFFGIGIPALYAQYYHSPEDIARWNNATLGWWWHSAEDTLDKLDRDLFEKTLRAYAAYVWQFCTAPILPLEFVSVAREFEGRLKELQNQAGGGLDLSAAIEKAEAFRKSAQRLDQHIPTLTSSGREADDIAQMVNQCLMRLSRILTPVSSTVTGKYEQDSYGLTALTLPLPGLFEVGTLATLDPESEARKLLLTRLIRERNKVIDALSDAHWLIESVLRQVP
jgi:hypothetical protein